MQSVATLDIKLRLSEQCHKLQHINIIIYNNYYYKSILRS